MEERDGIYEKALAYHGLSDSSLLELIDNDVDSIFATLQDSMGLEEMECRIVVSSMVQEAVTRGLIRALSEEAAEQLANKDLDLCKASDNLKDRDAVIAKLERTLQAKQEEFDAHLEENHKLRYRETVDFLCEREHIQQKWRESETLVAAKEKELCEMAKNLVEMASILDSESASMAMLERQIKELQDADSTKTREIIVLHVQIEKMETEHHSYYSRLKREARLEELKFNENMDLLVAGKNKQINKLERLLSEKDDQMTELENMLKEKEKLIESLEQEITQCTQVVQDIEVKEIRLGEEIGKLPTESKQLFLMERDTLCLQEELEEQRFLRDAEQGLLMAFCDGQMLVMGGELEQLRERLQESAMQWRQLEESLCIIQELKSSLEVVLQDTERINSQKEAYEKQSCTLKDKGYLLKKGNEELSNFKRKVDEMQSCFSYPEENFLSAEEQMNEHRWRLEVEIATLSSHWQSLVSLLQDEKSTFCRELSDAKQMLHKTQNLLEEAQDEVLIQRIENDALSIFSNHLQTEVQEMVAGRIAQQDESEQYLSEIADLERRLEYFKEDLESKLASREAELSKAVESSEELEWKSNVENMIILTVIEGLSSVVTNEFNYVMRDMALKDEDLFCLGLEADQLKCALEKLEIDFNVLKCTFAIPMPMATNACLQDGMDAGFVQGRDFKPRNKSNLDQEPEGEMAVSVEMGNPTRSRDMLEQKLEERKNLVLQLEEKLVGQQVQHELEMGITAQILDQKYQEAAERMMALRYAMNDEELEVIMQKGEAKITMEALNIKCSEITSLRNELKTSRRCLEELKLQLECLIHSGFCEIEKIEFGCSILSSKCENLNNLAEILCNQVRQLERKILMLQEGIEQQGWTHKIEDEILVFVLMDALGEMQRKLEAVEAQGLELKVDTGVYQRGGASEVFTPLSLVECSPKPKDDQKEQSGLKACLEKLEPLGTSDNDKLISLLKRENEELRREREHIYELKTEEIYKLKREFWKAREKWRSGLSSPRERETEGSKLFMEGSAWLEHIFKNTGILDNMCVSSKLREEWQIDKVGLQQKISQKENDLKELTRKVGELTEKDKSHCAMASQFLTRIANLEAERKQLMAACCSEQSQMAKLREEWQAEKAGLQEMLLQKERELQEIAEEFTKIVEKEKTHTAAECQLVAQLAELRDAKEQLIAAFSFETRLREECQLEKADLLEMISERERNLLEVTEKYAKLVEKEKCYVRTEVRLLAHIAELEAENQQLIKSQKNKKQEEKRISILEEKVQDLGNKLKKKNEEVVGLQRKQDAIHGQLELKFSEQINWFVEAYQKFEYEIAQRIQKKLLRLDGTKQQFNMLKGHLETFAARESNYKRKLSREFSNLQKAEAEVDLLGDEADALFNLLEKVYAALDLYVPVLQHCPGLTELYKVVKQEIQLRLDARYGY